MNQKINTDDWNQIISGLKVLNMVVVGQKLPEEEVQRMQVIQYILQRSRENDKLIKKIEAVRDEQIDEQMGDFRGE